MKNRKLDNIRFGIEIEAEFPKTEDSYELIRKHRLIRGWEMDFDGCFDEKTMILTDSGYKYFKDLTYNDKVLSMNPETEEADYYPIKKIIKKKYNRSMFELNTKTCSFKLSPNHYLYGKKHKKGKNEFIIASELYHDTKKYSEFYIPKTFKWKGNWKTYRHLTIEGYLYKGHKYHNKGQGTYKQYQISMKTWVKFLGLYLSEGYINEKLATITITQAVGSRYNNHIRQVINALPFKSKIYKKKSKRKNEQDCYHYNIYSRILTDYLKQYGDKCFNKFIPNYVTKLTSIDINIFLQYYGFGDGHLKKNKKWSFSTTSKKMSLGLQELILKTGKYASIKSRKPNNKNEHIQYIINVYNVNSPHFILTKNIIATENIGGMIYCVETKPYNLIYVMRNGTSYWSRNSLDNGAEYRPKDTNKLYFTKDSIDQIKEIIGLIKAHKGKIKPSCGLHCHIDMKKFTDQEIVNIVKAFIKYQSKIYRDFKVVKGRFVYAEKIPKDITKLINTKIIKEIKEREEMLNINSNLPDYFTERDFALNLQSLNLHNTLEFRLFNGTIQDRKIKSYIKWAIEFCLMFAGKK